MTAKLVLRVEPHRGEAFTHEFEGDSLVFGRSSKADLVVPDPYISRQQARIFRDGDRWLVEHLGGRNATLVNGRAVERPEPIAPGDLILVSDSRLRVEGSGSPPLTDTPSDSGQSLFRPASDLLAEREARERQAEAGPDLRRYTARLRALNDFYRSMAARQTLAELLELLLDRSFADLSPEEGVVILRGTDGEYRRASQRRIPGLTGEFLYSRSLVREVVEKGLAALVVDVSADDRFAAAQSLLSSGVRSLVAAPLPTAEGCIGLIVLNSRVTVRRFTEQDMEELTFLAAAAALRARNIALAEEAAARRALEKELALARQIQMALLPAELPPFPGFELVASNIPTRAVSGDLYQVQLRREESECVLLLADVAGKGMSASLLTASLEALAVGPIEVGLPPEGICGRLSRRLHARTSPERYATGFIAVLHRDGRFCYANAGHNAALLVRASGGHLELAATGLPLGLLPVDDYERRELKLDRGDLIMIYTDGVTEAANTAGEEYGFERLTVLCRRHAAEGVSRVADELQKDLEAFAEGVPFADDRTFLLLRRL